MWAIRSRPDQPCAASIGALELRRRSGRPGPGTAATPRVPHRGIPSRRDTCRHGSRETRPARPMRRVGPMMRGAGTTSRRVFTDEALRERATAARREQRPSRRRRAARAGHRATDGRRLRPRHRHAGPERDVPRLVRRDRRAAAPTGAWRRQPPNQGKLPPRHRPARPSGARSRLASRVQRSTPPRRPISRSRSPSHAGRAGTTWVITEAWWAADLRPPESRPDDRLPAPSHGRRSSAASLPGYRERSPLLDRARRRRHRRGSRRSTGGSIERPRSASSR